MINKRTIIIDEIVNTLEMSIEEPVLLYKLFESGSNDINIKSILRVSIVNSISGQYKISHKYSDKISDYYKKQIVKRDDSIILIDSPGYIYDLDINGKYYLVSFDSDTIITDLNCYDYVVTDKDQSVFTLSPFSGSAKPDKDSIYNYLYR